MIISATRGVTIEHLRESNLIEGIDDPQADRQSYDAWQWCATRPTVDLDTILGLHHRITGSQLGEHAGRLRQVNVRVGPRVASPWQQVPGMLAEWVGKLARWADHDPQQMHIEFEHIHPFVDGNGRTGRCLMWWHEVRLGRAPTLLRADDRQRYYDWFRRPQDAPLFRWLLAEALGER